MQPNQPHMQQNGAPGQGVVGSGNPGQPQAGQPVVAKNPNSTQNSLQIAEMREGMLIMNDGSFRAVVQCQSINFDLMSSREREGVEYSYQAFLNSLYFPVQILVRSQRVDIAPYLERLSKIRISQDNMLLGMLMDDYINFIDVLAHDANIMDKSFYITVPYFTAGDVAAFASAGKNIFSAIFKPQVQTHIMIDTNSYNKAKDEISNRVNVVTSGLFQMGVQSVQLDTKQLGELFYNMYNPDTAVREPLVDFNHVTGTYVKRAPAGTVPPQPGQYPMGGMNG